MIIIFQMTAEMMAGLVSCADESAMGAAGGGAALTPDIRGSRARSSRWSTAKASRELGKCRSVHDLPKVDDVRSVALQGRVVLLLYLRYVIVFVARPE